MSELGFNLNATPLYGDNQGLIFIASNPVAEKQSKHIDIRSHFIRDCVERGCVCLSWTSSGTEVADIFTKPLPLDSHSRHTCSLGLCRV